MPWLLAEIPRQIFPPPMTIAVSTPCSATRLICRARRSTTTGSMPKADSPTIASPLSLRRTRWNRSFATTPPRSARAGQRADGHLCHRRFLLVRRAVSRSDFETGKPSYNNILAELSDPLPDEIPDGHFRVLDEWLFEQDHGGGRLFTVTVLLFEISPCRGGNFVD